MHRKFKSPLLQGWKRAQKTGATGHRSDRSRLLGGHCASTIPVKYKLPRGNTKQASFFQLWHIPNSAQYRGACPQGNLPQTVRYVNYTPSFGSRANRGTISGHRNKASTLHPKWNWQKTCLCSKIQRNHF